MTELVADVDRPETARPIRHRAPDLVSATLRKVCHFVWHGTAPEDDSHMWSIPVDEERDWDCILGDVIRERDALHAATRALLAALDEEECNRDGVLVLPPDPRCSACTASGTVPTQPCARHAAALLVQYGPFDPAGGRDG
jgi:hypothetical protein